MKNTAQEIRTEIKTQLGFNSSHVSVRKDGGSVDVTIKTVEAYAKLAEIEEIASGFEKYQRCELTHEILSGGNTFVFTRVAESVMDEISSPYIADAERACNEAEARPGYCVEVARSIYVVSYEGRNGMGISLITGTGENYKSEHLGRMWFKNYREIAIYVATKGVDRVVEANETITEARAEEIPAAPATMNAAQQALDVLEGVQVDLIPVPSETAPTQSEPASTTSPEPVKVSKIDLAKKPASLPSIPGGWTFTAGFDFQYC